MIYRQVMTFQYSVIKNSITTFILLFFLSFNYVFAQDDCTRTGYLEDGDQNQTCIYSPKNLQIYNYGDIPFFCAATGRGTKEIALIVTHLAGGFKNGQALPMTQDEIIYHEENGVANCRVQMCRDIENTCGRSGLFKFKVIFRHNRDSPMQADCQTKKTGSLEGSFTILPNTDIGLSGINYLNQFVCPGSNVKLTVDSKAENQDGVRWYDFVTGNILHDGYVYETSIQELQTKNFFIKYYQNKTIQYSNFENGDPTTKDVICKQEGINKVFSATGLSVDALASPVNIVEFLCEPEEITTTIRNLNNEFTGVRWFSDASRTKLVHDGLSYKRFYSATTILYTEYYKDYGDCQQISAVPGSVTIFIAKNEVTAVLDDLNLISNPGVKIYDYRDFSGETCTSSSIFFADLSDFEGDFPSSQSFSTSNNLISGSFEFNTFWRSSYKINDKLVLLRDGESFDGFTADLFDRQGSKKLVCADHVGLPENKYGSRTYQYTANANFIYNVYIGNTEYPQSKSCPVDGIRKVYVQTRPINDSSPDSICQAVNLEIYAAATGNTLDGCTRSRIRNICPEDDNIKLGPTEEELYLLYEAAGGELPFPLIGLGNISYSWTPSSGLSDPNISNPFTQYDDVECDPYEFFKYSLQIIYADGTEAYYCEILYKCNACGAIPDPVPALDLLNQ